VGLVGSLVEELVELGGVGELDLGEPAWRKSVKVNGQDLESRQCLGL
jgi:hypothetical protein